MAQMVKNPPTMWESWVQALGWEDPLEKQTVIHSRTIAWKVPWTEEPGRLQSMGSQRVRMKPIIPILTWRWQKRITYRKKFTNIT